MAYKRRLAILQTEFLDIADKDGKHLETWDMFHMNHFPYLEEALTNLPSRHEHNRLAWDSCLAIHLKQQPRQYK